MVHLSAKKYRIVQSPPEEHHLTEIILHHLPTLASVQDNLFSYLYLTEVTGYGRQKIFHCLVFVVWYGVYTMVYGP